MGFTQQQLDDLERQIAEGVSSSQYKDKRQTFRSLDDLMKLRDIMRKELGLEDPGIVGVTHQYHPHPGRTGDEGADSW